MQTGRAGDQLPELGAPLRVSGQQA